MASPTIAERFAYGRPLDLGRDSTWIPLAMRPGTALAGRILLAAIFLISGIAKVTDPSGTIAHMTAHGVPYPEILVWVAGFAEIAGGLSLALGLLARVGAIGLMIFLVPTTLLFHDFWNLTGQEQIAQMANFMKNLAIAGGLAMIVAYGPGRYSLDYKMRKPMQP
jgi:putative oxidoreductase